jgi:limonene-1,2-epoxide hydrolase
MIRTPSELVTDFCRLWASPDPTEMASYFTDGAIYQSIPMDSIHGREAIRDFIAGYTAAYGGVDFIVHRQVSDGNLVMNERTDILRRRAGGEVRVPVMGVFETAGGRIAAWRDYFNLAAGSPALDGVTAR